MLQRVYGQRKLDLVYISSFFLVGEQGHKGRGVSLGGLGSEGDWGALCKIPK